MLFDTKPKEKREDLFDMDGELTGLAGAMDRGEPLIVLTGLRRTGKTSVLRVALSESSYPYALVDLRQKVISYQGVYGVFAEVLAQLLKKRSKLARVLKGLRGVEVGAFGVSLVWRREERADLGAILDRLNTLGERVLVAFDEAQLIKGRPAHQFTSLLAHCYDYCPNLIFVLTGSEAGLLYSTLGVDDPEAPLYGRYTHEVRVNRFTPELSREFLVEGFREYGIEPPKRFLDEAVEYLDGVAGWLTYLGHRAATTGDLSTNLIKKVFVEAAKTSVREATHFSKAYLEVCRGLAQGLTRWAELKRHVESKLGKTMNDALFNKYLEGLISRGYVEKTGRGYTLLDPILAKHLST